jgi:outer membrane protein TolC
MSAARRKIWHLLTMIALGVVVGSRVGLGQTVRRLPPAATQAAATVAQLASNSTGEPAASCLAESSCTATPVQPVIHWQPLDEGLLPNPAGETESLQLEPLVAEVLLRNPDIRSAAAAWRAAAQRYPQAISLDDPMFGFMLGPGSWGSDLVESAYMLEASQKVPWPGKRQLRGSIARAEANAAYYDVGEQRLRIAEATKLAYYDYFLAHRQLAVLEESASLLRGFREIALKRFESAQTEQQDVLLADVELAQLERQRLALARAERVARARINTLLLAAADSPLPAPPETLPIRASFPAPDALIDTALAQRPELAAQAARIRREQYAAALARKEFLPDVELVARYDAFWQEEPLRPMIGMNLNVPIYQRKRWAALREANARGAQQQATRESQVYEIIFAVEQAYQRLQESGETIRVYEDQILPSAHHSIEAAEASYTAGRLDFLRLIESQRQLLLLQDGYYEAVAEYQQRLAELERAVGAAL